MKFGGAVLGLVLGSALGAPLAAQAAAPAKTAAPAKAATPAKAAGPAKAPGLWATVATLRGKKWVDLTHTFDTDTPHWKGFGEMKRETKYTVKKDGFWVEEMTHVGQWGTHIDPPIHFHEGLRSTETIPVTDMLMPLVVLDVHDKVAKNPDYTLTMDDINAYEAKHGAIPAGAFVAMRTDWAKRWPNQDKMQNRDAKGVAHYPGWSKETLEFLYHTRKITASGHETTDTDPGLATTKDDYSLESWLLKQNHYQIEMLDHLDKVPEAGALVVVAWPKLRNGSGFPARVFAILP